MGNEASRVESPHLSPAGQVVDGSANRSRGVLREERPQNLDPFTPPGKLASQHGVLERSPDVRFQFDHQVLELQQDLRNCVGEAERIASAIRGQQEQQTRFEQEAQIYREAMTWRDEKLARRHEEEQTRVARMVWEYKERMAVQRQAVERAILTCQAKGRVIEELLPECRACEALLLGEITHLPTQVEGAKAPWSPTLSPVGHPPASDFA